MALAEFREAVLRLERVVSELVVRRERLRAERGIGDASSVEDVDEWKQLVERAAALVLFRVPDDEVVRHAAADHGVPLADAGPDVLQNRVIRIRKAQELRAV